MKMMRLAGLVGWLAADAGGCRTPSPLAPSIYTNTQHSNTLPSVQGNWLSLTYLLRTLTVVETITYSGNSQLGVTNVGNSQHEFDLILKKY